MSTKVTVLRAQRHREFLAAQRQDPITRKAFAAGDRIVLCATCLLPFLRESWDAMGGEHCGQSVTAGLEAFGAEVETTAGLGAADSGAADAGNGSATQPAAATPATTPGLSPIPIKLREVPVTLR